MATKYYHAENCNRRFEHQVEFKPYRQLAGTWCGLFATDKPVQQVYLDGLASNPATAVTALTQDEYERKIGAPDRTENYAPSPEPYRAQPLPAPAAVIAEKAGVVVQEPEPQPEPETAVKASEALPSVEAALVVDTVQKPGGGKAKGKAEPKQQQQQQ